MSLYITDENGKLHKIAGAGGGSGVVSNEAIEFAESERQKSKNLSVFYPYSGTFTGSDYKKVGNNIEIKQVYSAHVLGFVYDAQTTNLTLSRPNYDALTGFKFTGLKPSTKYVISCTLVTPPDSGIVVLFGWQITSSSAIGTRYTRQITTDTNGEYIVASADNSLWFNTSGISLTINEFQLEEGTIATEYQEYNGKILHEADIEASGGGVEPNIITGMLLANYTVASNSVYYDLPLIKYNSVGTKLSINSSGGIVVGDGVSHVKVSASCPMSWNEYSGQIIVAICRNSECVHFVWAMIKSSNVNTLPCSLSPVVIPVKSGDVITLAAWKNEISSVIVEGHNSAARTSLTVEVVE